MRPRLAQLAAVLAVAALSVPLAPALRAAPAAHAARDETSVAVAVLDVSPSTPKPVNDRLPLTLKLRLTNTTDQTLSGLRLDVSRGCPISTSDALEAALADPKPSGAQCSQQLPSLPLTSPLLPGTPRAVVYALTAGLPVTEGNLCLCYTGVYPIDLTVSGDTGVLGRGQTYLPSFQSPPTRVQVSWLWPIIDRPHRLAADDVFLDDDLARSVARGGRLDRVLQVVEALPPGIRLTLVIDPELIDELAVMTAGYRLRTANGTLAQGGGGPAAKAWLAGLRVVLRRHDVDLTPPADPDLDALHDAGLTRVPLTTTQQARVTATLGATYPSDILWPAGNTITAGALRDATGSGASLVVVDDQTLPGGRDASPRPDALASMSVLGMPGGIALVTDSTLQTRIAAVVNAGQAGTGALPQLVATLAMRAAQQPDASHYAVLAPDRYVDPAPAAAVRAIVETSASLWSTSVTVRAAARTRPPVDRGTLTVPSGAPEARLSAAILARIADASADVDALNSALAQPRDAARLLGGFPSALRRAESAAWRRSPVLGLARASTMRQDVAGLIAQVTINPVRNSYTLASKDSYLFVTVVNKLPYAVTVRLDLRTANGTPGFSADSVQLTVSPSNPSQTVKIHPRVERAGHFQIVATLHTPDGHLLGTGVPINVNSTALGGVGVVITAIALAVLVLALAVRVVRRLRAPSAPVSALP